MEEMEEGCSYRGNRNINSADCGIMIHKTGGSGTGNTHRSYQVDHREIRGVKKSVGRVHCL